MYLQYGVQILTRQFPLPALSSLLSIFLALLTLSFAHLLALVSQTPYSTRGARRFLADYGMPIAVVACSAVAYWGRLREGLGEGTTLPVGGAWSPEGGRAWVVRFWEMDAKWVGVALPFGVVLFIVSLDERRSRGRSGSDEIDWADISRSIRSLLWTALCVRPQRIVRHGSIDRLPSPQTSRVPLGLSVNSTCHPPPCSSS